MKLLPLKVEHDGHGSVLIELPIYAPQGLRSFLLRAVRQWLDIHLCKDCQSLTSTLTP